MSGWNHRVFHSVLPDGDWFSIHETYYNKNGQPDAATEDSMAPGGETPVELADELSRMLAACSKPVLAFVDDKIVEWKP